MSVNINDPMMDVFIYETSQQVEQLEQSVINIESSCGYAAQIINEIFRIMHTIKSSAAMMLFNNISMVAHSTEDLFYFIRESKPDNLDSSSLCDLVLESVDFIKLEIEKIKNGDAADGDAAYLIERIKEYLQVLKKSNDTGDIINKEVSNTKQQFYISSNKSAKQINKNIFKATIRFQDGCQMENIRAFAIIHNLKDITAEFRYIPEDIIDKDDSSEIIRKDGFTIYMKTNKSYSEMEIFFNQTAFLEQLELIEMDKEHDDYFPSNNNEGFNNEIKIPNVSNQLNEKEIASGSNYQNQSIISVNVEKLDKLMNLVGEMVIAESMVTQNPDLEGLSLNNFHKAARQLRKITGELQDTVMSIRMVPLGPTFFKMNRIVRDMSKKLNKEVHLDILGEDTEVDKNIIEHIGDPLMHIVRNALDHGIETSEERVSKNKSKAGTITLEAKNAGSEVLIIIKDDGKGLNKEKILQKARENELLKKAQEEMSDREIFNLIFLPGFSTKEAVTEFSGRGVGMDVVSKNIETVGGSIHVDSTEGEGTIITLKIPLTLAIIDGMNIRVGNSRYTIPTIAIKESFRLKEDEAFKDPEGNEMIMIREKCYPILRLHQLYNVQTSISNLHEGIVIIIENANKAFCLFADELLGEQQVVVKALPNYIKSIKKIKGLAGCTLLGDGSISLILDVDSLIN